MSEETNVQSVRETTMWPEIRKAFDKKQFELCLVGPEIAKRIKENNDSLDSNIYRLKHVNFIEIARTGLSSLSKEIAALQNLTTLICHTNQLTSIPVEVGQLLNLKNLDLSNNQITSLPEELQNLKELFTVNLSGNQLNSLFPLSNLSKLAVLDLNRNKFKKLPDDLGSEALENLSQINVSYNELEELSENLSLLPALKTLNLENNKITEVPSALSQCPKLKDLLLKENKLKDNRLRKLVDQDKQKAILDYLEKAYAEESKTRPKKNLNTTTNKKKTKSETFLIEYDLIKVLHCNDEKFKSKEIVYMDSVSEVRPYILCAIFKQIDLETPGNFKKFLNIQTKIHEETLEKRTLGTIGTHDLDCIKAGELYYEAIHPDNIEFVPLGRKNPLIASEYYAKLLEEAEAERKAKKRNQLSGIYKYLTLLENKDKFAFVREDESQVISLPPLSNSERTKMSANTRNILIEITSSENMEVCKKAMEELIVEMFKNGIVSKETNSLDENMQKLNLKDEKQNDAENGENSESKLKSTIIMQQVKVVNSKGDLKSVYPSRVDLTFGNSNKFRVNRLYDE